MGIDNNSIEEVFKSLGTSPKGLSSEEARRRLAKYGLNALVEKKGRSIPYKFVTHLRDLFSILLIFASILAAISGMFELGLIIFIIVLMNAAFSLFQEWRAEKAIETLKRWMPEYAKVVRDGEMKKIPVKELVLGDIAVLEEGDRVPADALLIEAFDLWTNNVPLTGESEPQPRTVTSSGIPDKTYIDAPNLVFMSTSVAKGHGRAVVFATGMNTRFGQIASLAQEITEEESPLQKEIAHTAKYTFIMAVTIGSVFFVATLLWLHLDFFSSILFFIGVMIACVPEGMQVTVSSALAISVLKMLKENVLVKRLSAVQTLGSVTVICTDKTGTITTGEMTVKKIWTQNKVIEVSGVGYTPLGDFTHEGKTLERETFAIDALIEISALCNSAKVEPPSDRNKSWGIIGDPTDGALLIAALKYGLNVQDVLAQKPIIHMIPFDSTRKRMTTIHKYDNKTLVYMKGAPRNVFSVCTKMIAEDKIEDLTEEKLHGVEQKIHEFADDGLRVIAIAYKELPRDSPFDIKVIEREMILVGFVAMKDPPRLGVREAVKLAKKAGIKIVMITGDYGPTARAIAEEVGIIESGEYRIIRGIDLDALSDQQIMEEIKGRDVIFARALPEQKLRIVKILRQRGEIVTVTGDGANDTPSLKEADIGIAMGASGTDVARDAADMILLDDSFASIVKAVESGRAIYENIRRIIIYEFSHNWAQLIPYILYASLAIPLPLLVVQILVIDLCIDIIPSLALSREPPEPGIMDEPPRSIYEHLFSSKVFFRSLYVGLIIATGGMWACLSAWSAGGWHLGVQLNPHDIVYIKGTTMMFASIVVAQVGNVLACRTSKESIFKISFTNNKWIWFSVFTQISILSVIVYIPFFQGIFSTTALGLNDWLCLSLLAVIVVFAEEIRKLFTRKLSD